MTLSRGLRLLPAVAMLATACGMAPGSPVASEPPPFVADEAGIETLVTIAGMPVTMEALLPVEPIVEQPTATAVAEEATGNPQGAVQSIEISTYAYVGPPPSTPPRQGVVPIPRPPLPPVDSPQALDDPQSVAAPLEWRTSETTVDTSVEDTVAALEALYRSRGFEVTVQWGVTGSGSSLTLYVVSGDEIVGAVAVSETADGTRVSERWAS